MKILLLDNYDSFTYNLLQIIEKQGCSVDVRRNDRINVEDAARYDKIILSPGPGIPSEAGILLPLIERYAPEKSILGVCLGHQAIAETFGARLENLPQVYHGVQSEIRITGDDYIFGGLPATQTVGRYHSWVVAADSLPECLAVTAADSSGMIMALRHRTYDVHGVQFHPESVLTPQGEQIIVNFLEH